MFFCFLFLFICSFFISSFFPVSDIPYQNRDISKQEFIAIAKMIRTIPHFVVILPMAKRSLRKILQNSSPATMPIQITQRNLFIGLLILKRIIKPTIASRSVEAVEISSLLNPKTRPKTVRKPTKRTSVKPAGSAFKNTLVRKCPCIIFLLGSIASKNAGIPIVNIPIREICEGSSG